VLLLQGMDNDDPLFLGIKELGESVLAPHIGIKLPLGPPRAQGSLWAAPDAGFAGYSWVGDALMGEISMFVSSRNRRAPPHSGRLIVCPIAAECVAGRRCTPSRARRRRLQDIAKERCT
jgi:hypothetical protein